MTPPASQACGCWGLMSMCGTTRTDAAEAHVNSPASWTTRGKDHPTARLLDLVPGRSGTVHENWLAKRGKDFRAGVRIGGWIPSKGQQERHRLASSTDATSVLDAFHIVKLAGDAPGEVRRRVQQDTTGHRGRKGGSPLSNPASPARLAHAILPCVNKNDSAQPSRQMKHTSSVEVAYRCAQHVREVFHQATPAHGRRLAARLIESLPTCPIPEIARLGADPTQMEGRTRRLLRHSRSQQRTPPKPSTDIIELDRHTARGYPNPTNHKLRMLLITGGLDASTHTQL